ncbi:hypothetical protein Hte_008448 [Hypoxylon texense]
MTSLYEVSIVLPTRILKTEVTVLDKAEAWAKENGVPMADLVGARLIDDMYPLSMQIVITALFAQKAVELLAGGPKMAKPFQDCDLEGCRGLLAESLAMLAEVKPEDVNGKEDEAVEFSIGRRTAKSKAVECT